MRGLSGLLALICYFVAIGLLPLATSMTPPCTSPIFVALLLTLIFGESLRPPAFLAIGAGFVGIVPLLRPSVQAEQWAGAAIERAGGEGYSSPHDPPSSGRLS